jgi:citrate synthase
MVPDYETHLSTHDEQSITVREKDLATEVMGTMSFPASLYYLWTGTTAGPGEERVIEAMLPALMVHGVTPSSVVSRLTLFTEPEAVQAAVASAIGGVGSQYIGTMKECSDHLHRIAAADATADAVADTVAAHLDRGDPFPGIGHPHLDPVDPRAERLIEIAEAEGVTGVHLEALRDVRDTFEDETGATLPINVTGAIAALTADLGLSPTAARGIAIVSRTTGVIAEVLEEQQTPIAGEIWQHVDQHAGDPED